MKRMIDLQLKMAEMRRERGIETIEFILLLVVIVVFLVGAFFLLREPLQNLINSITDCVDTAGEVCESQ